MRKIKQSIIITAALALILPTAALTAPPAIPLLVYGNASIDGKAAPVGTVITAEINNAKVAETTVAKEGKYYIDIPDGSVNENKTIVFKINGSQAGNCLCSNVNSVPSMKLDLSIAAAEPESEPAPTPAPSGGGGGSANPPSPPEPPTDEDEPLLEDDEPLTQEPEGILEEEEEEVIVLGVEADYRTIQLNKIINEAGYIWKGDASVIAGNMAVGRDPKAEVSGYNKYTSSLISGMDGLEQSNIYAITNFIVYGTPTTEILGAGERAGVLNSYKSAFDRLPGTESEWQDAIKIANGRWPNERSETAETKAKKEFKKVYLREPDMDNPNDNAAVTVIAYGLRPDARNLDSEKAGILTFKHIYGYNPSSATDWDIVRAIAYSGAVR